MKEPVAVIVSTSVDSVSAARELADTLVAERLAACVHIAGPVTSIYRWQGVTEQATEWTCACKTSVAVAPALIARIRELHSYAVPEILATPVLDGSAEYLAWVSSEVTQDP